MEINKKPISHRKAYVEMQMLERELKQKAKETSKLLRERLAGLGVDVTPRTQVAITDDSITGSVIVDLTEEQRDAIL